MKETSNTRPSDEDKARLENATTILKAIYRVLELLQDQIKDAEEILDTYAQEFYQEKLEDKEIEKDQLQQKKDALLAQ